MLRERPRLWMNLDVHDEVWRRWWCDGQWYLEKDTFFWTMHWTRNIEGEKHYQFLGLIALAICNVCNIYIQKIYRKMYGVIQNT